jgi:predicted glycosyltransferase
VLVREMQDSEQLLHLERLQQHLGAGLRVIPETGLTAETLANAIENQLRSPPLTTETIGLAGAERAARHLMALIQADA